MDENKCPHCGGNAIVEYTTTGGCWADCQSENCMASGPFRPTEAEALSAFAMPMDSGAMMDALTESGALWSALRVDDVWKFEIRKVRITVAMSGATFREAVIAAYDEAKARGWLK